MTITIIENKKAKFDFFIEEKIEAGISLKGWEVKSLRSNRGNIKESYALVKNNEIFIIGSHISPMPNVSANENTDPTILKWRFVGVKNFPKEIKKEVKNKSDSITYYHKWKKNDFIMLDNRRFMHGRNKILKSDNKKIYNIQTLLSNIPRKIIYFKKT